MSHIGKRIPPCVDELESPTPAAFSAGFLRNPLPEEGVIAGRALELLDDPWASPAEKKRAARSMVFLAELVAFDVHAQRDVANYDQQPRTGMRNRELASR